MFIEEQIYSRCNSIFLQNGGQLFPTHKFILASASPQFLAQLLTASTCTQDNEFNDSIVTMKLNCNNPSVVEAFLHYVYGAHLKVVPPTVNHTPGQSGLGNGLPGTSSTSSLDPETTPDTSFNASVDENDLTGVYLSLIHI